MTDDESPLERDLRRMLSDPGYRLPDRLVPLERVHAGAVRRRRQRQAATATFSVVALLAVSIGIAHPWTVGGSGRGQVAASQGPSTPFSSSTSTSTSAPTGSPSVTPPTSSSSPSHVVPGRNEGVTSVTALGPNTWWVSTVTGNGSSLLATTDGGKSFVTVQDEIDRGFANTGIHTARFVDAQRGTELLDNSTLQATSDGGKTWTPVASDAGGFVALEAGGGKTTWALRKTATSVELWSESGSGWHSVATVPEAASAPAPVMTVEGGNALVFWTDSQSKLRSAAYDATGSHAGVHEVAGCPGELGVETLSAGLRGVWLTCRTGTLSHLLLTTDLGATWKQVNAEYGWAGALGAIDDTHTALSGSSGLYLVDTTGSLTKAVMPDGVDGSLVSYLGFTTAQDGFAITADKGQLLRSTDGGLHWVLVKYST